MIINIGDTIRDSRGREGEIVNIGIVTEKTDIAVENDTSLNAQTYDTELNYTGAVIWFKLVLLRPDRRSNEKKSRRYGVIMKAVDMIAVAVAV